MVWLEVIEAKTSREHAIPLRSILCIEACNSTQTRIFIGDNRSLYTNMSYQAVMNLIRYETDAVVEHSSEKFNLRR